MLKYADFISMGSIGEGKSPVLKMQHKQTGKLYAMKRITVDDYEQHTQAIHEISLCMLCRHPKIVQIIGYDVEQSKSKYVIYLFMELMLCTLGQIIIERNEMKAYFTLDELCSVLSQCVEALHFCQDKYKVAHRDIKCDNILIDFDGTCKMADFAEAFIYNEVQEQSRSVVGTPAYMSPELRREHSKGMFCGNDRPVYDCWKSDVYSLAVTMLEMATLSASLFTDAPVQLQIEQLAQIYGEPFQEVLQWMVEEDASLRPDFIDLVESDKYATLMSSVNKSCRFTLNQVTNKISLQIGQEELFQQTLQNSSQQMNPIQMHVNSSTTTTNSSSTNNNVINQPQDIHTVVDQLSEDSFNNDEEQQNNNNYDSSVASEEEKLNDDNENNNHHLIPPPKQQEKDLENLRQVLLNIKPPNQNKYQNQAAAQAYMQDHTFSQRFVMDCAQQIYRLKEHLQEKQEEIAMQKELQIFQQKNTFNYSDSMINEETEKKICPEQLQNNNVCHKFKQIFDKLSEIKLDDNQNLNNPEENYINYDETKRNFNKYNNEMPQYSKQPIDELFFHSTQQNQIQNYSISDNVNVNNDDEFINALIEYNELMKTINKNQNADFH